MSPSMEEGHQDDAFEKQRDHLEAFEDREVRFGFIRKVYGILSIQLCITVGFVGMVMNVAAGNKIDADGKITLTPAFITIFNPAIIGTSVALYFCSFCALVCCRMDRKVPLNYILLLTFTVCVSYLVSLICLMYPPQTVFLAAGLTLAMVIGLTIFAFTTKQDFTICGPIMYTIGMLFLAGILFAILMPGNIRHIIYSILGVFLFSFYLICDTQAIIGGKKHGDKSITEDDYILASLLLYMDIINLFLEILKLMGDR